MSDYTWKQIALTVIGTLAGCAVIYAVGFLVLDKLANDIGALL